MQELRAHLMLTLFFFTLPTVELVWFLVVKSSKMVFLTFSEVRLILDFERPMLTNIGKVERAMTLHDSDRKG